MTKRDLEKQWQQHKAAIIDGNAPKRFPKATLLKELRRPKTPKNLYVICHPDGAVYESDTLKGLFENMGKVDIYDLIEGRAR